MTKASVAKTNETPEDRPQVATVQYTSLVADEKKNPRGPIDRDDERFKALVTSIRRVGLLQPIVVTPIDGGKFEVKAGFRRYFALAVIHPDPANLIVPVRFVYPETRGVGLIIAGAENFGRDDMPALERAQVVGDIYLETKMTQREMADALGISPASVNHYQRIAIGLTDATKARVRSHPVDISVEKLLTLSDVPKVDQASRFEDVVAGRVQREPKGNGGRKPSSLPMTPVAERPVTPWVIFANRIAWAILRDWGPSKFQLLEGSARGLIDTMCADAGYRARKVKSRAELARIWCKAAGIPELAVSVAPPKVTKPAPSKPAKKKSKR